MPPTPDPRIPEDLSELLHQQEWARALARGLVGAGDADDLVQEAWVSLLAQHRAGRRYHRGGLRQVLRSRAIDRHRRESKRREREQVPRPENPQLPPDERAAAFEQHRRLVAALHDLPEPYRGTLIARYFEEVSVRELARRDGVAEASVRSRIGRGLSMLREKLDDSFGEERLAGLLALAAFAGGSSGEVASAATSSFSGGGVTALAILVVLILLLGVVRPWSFGSKDANGATSAAAAVGGSEEETRESPAPASGGVPREFAESPQAIDPAMDPVSADDRPFAQRMAIFLIMQPSLAISTNLLQSQVFLTSMTSNTVTLSLI